MNKKNLEPIVDLNKFNKLDELNKMSIKKI